MTPDQSERTERLQVLLSVHELAAIDEFRFENRMPNGSTAVRELLRLGLRAVKKGHSPRITHLPCGAGPRLLGQILAPGLRRERLRGTLSVRPKTC